MKVYQPYFYSDDGTNLTYGDMPEELHENMAFPSRSDCEEWLDMNDYEPGDYAIIETDEEKIEGLVLLDGYGDFLDGTGSLSAYNSGQELDRAQERLFKAIKEKDPTGLGITFKTTVVLYESKHDILENHGLDPDLTDEERHGQVEIHSVDLDYAYDVDGTRYPIGDIVDLDDIDLLYDCVVYDI